MTYETHNKKNGKRYSPYRVKKNWRIGNKRMMPALTVEQGFRLVEKMFWYYKRVKQAVDEYRAEIGYYQSGNKTGGAPTSHAFVSDPTASLAMRRSAVIGKVVINADTPYEDVIARPEDWLYIVEHTLAYFADEELVGDVLRRRYLENEPMATTCIELGIKKDKYYKLNEIGIRYARECAIQIGLVRVFVDSRKAVSDEKKDLKNFSG